MNATAYQLLAAWVIGFITCVMVFAVSDSDHRWRKALKYRRARRKWRKQWVEQRQRTRAVRRAAGELMPKVEFGCPDCQVIQSMPGPNGELPWVDLIRCRAHGGQWFDDAETAQ